MYSCQYVYHQYYVYNIYRLALISYVITSDIKFACCVIIVQNTPVPNDTDKNDNEEPTVIIIVIACVGTLVITAVATFTITSLCYKYWYGLKKSEVGNDEDKERDTYGDNIIMNPNPAYGVIDTIKMDTNPAYTALT